MIEKNVRLKTITYQYNGVVLVSDMAVSGESSFTYSYNGRNQLSSVTNPNTVQVTFTYDNGGRRTRITDPGSYVEYVYNARNWITDVRNRTTGGTTRYDATYYYQDGSLWDHTGNPVKRVENLAGSTYTTTLRYDAVYRQTQETKKDGSNNTIYDLAYGYDAVGNRTARTLGGTTITYVYDDNNKLTAASGGGTSASFSYDDNGNMTGVSGTMFGSKTMVYNDDNRLTSIAYGGVTDLYYYTYEGLRYRARLGGTYYRYLYNGERVLEELNDSGTMQARYTTENGSYGGMLLHVYRSSGSLSRFPMYDNIGSARGLLDASGAATDWYELDTFGRQVSSSGTTPNPYRYGGAWGYITDPSGLQQLGQRYYWPELGRFVSQDPIRDGRNWYAYAGGNPVNAVDPEGLSALGGGAGGSCQPCPTKKDCAIGCRNTWQTDMQRCEDKYTHTLGDAGPNVVKYTGGGAVGGAAGGAAVGCMAGGIGAGPGAVVGGIAAGVGGAVTGVFDSIWDYYAYKGCVRDADAKYEKCMDDCIKK